ncbi:hypothetical protein [Renibacterium salmoninarum]|nr:hypothetical protein [Renibacterium salmoninarum]
MDQLATPQTVSDVPEILSIQHLELADTTPGTVMPEVLKELEFEFSGSVSRTITMDGGLTLCSSTSCSSSGSTPPTKGLIFRCKPPTQLNRPGVSGDFLV